MGPGAGPTSSSNQIDESGADDSEESSALFLLGTIEEAQLTVRFKLGSGRDGCPRGEALP